MYLTWFKNIYNLYKLYIMNTTELNITNFFRDKLELEAESWVKLLELYKEGDELEIRLGKFTINKNFKSNITEDKYNKLLDYFYKNNDFTCNINNYIINICPNGIKVISSNDSSNIMIKKIKKYKLDLYDKIDLGFRIALSKEIIIDNVPVMYRITKNRIRTTFTHNSNKYKIDISCDKDNRDFYKIYQCEIEFLQLPSINEIMDIISKFRDLF